MISPRFTTPTRPLFCRASYAEPSRPGEPSGPQPCSPYQANTHLRHLVKADRLLDARLLFDRMPHRDEVSWTTIISGYVRAYDAPEALYLFSRMRSDDPALSPDPFVLSLALKACGSAPSFLRHGESLHAYTIKTGALPSSVFIGSALLDMYSRTAHTGTSAAIQVFDEMPLRNVVTWTAAITALVRAGSFREAVRCFAEMRASGVPYDTHTYAIALKACADAGLLSRGREIHAHAAKVGIDAASFVANSLATLYCKCGHLPRGLTLFERMRAPDVVSWTTVISTYVQMGRDEDAIRSFVLMRDRPSDVSPNGHTYAAVVSACAGLSRITWGEQVHGHVTRRGFAGSMSVANALVTLYSRAGRLAAADTMFREMTFRDVVSWTAIISAYSQEGHVEETFALFVEMRRGSGGTRANEFTLASLLSACACAAVLDPGRQLHGHTLAAGLEGDAMIASALITMYSKCGSIEEAERVFNDLDHDDVVSWTAMINGYAEHGRSMQAIELFERMPAAGLAPDYVTFIGVLTACGHVGSVDLGLRCFERMRTEYGIEPGREHYGCMVDLLGRAGRLGEAERVIEWMPHGAADEVVWTALLRACGARGDAERGRRAARRVLELEPGCAGAHIALSNIYAAKGRWGEAGEMRRSMRAKGVRKEAGWSWIAAAGDGVAVFAAGERSHPRGEELYAMLYLVAYGARMAGYVPEGTATVELEAVH